MSLNTQRNGCHIRVNIDPRTLANCTKSAQIIKKTEQKRYQNENEIVIVIPINVEDEVCFPCVKLLYIE